MGGRVVVFGGTVLVLGGRVVVVFGGTVVVFGGTVVVLGGTVVVFGWVAVVFGGTVVVIVVFDGRANAVLILGTVDIAGLSVTAGGACDVAVTKINTNVKGKI